MVCRIDEHAGCGLSRIILVSSEDSGVARGGPGRRLFAEWPAAIGVYGVEMGPQQLGPLINAHGPALVLYARQWCAAPEDVVQDAFLKLVAQRRPPDDPAAWLFRVVRNAALDAAKADRRRQRREAAARPDRWFVEPDIE